MENNTVVNFPFVEGAEYSGMFQMDDYYIQAVEKGTIRNNNNRLIGSSFATRVVPPALDGKPLNRRHWALAGALWDPRGNAGPKENFWVYDIPFLTSGANCQWVEPAGKNGKSCAGQYFGVGGFQTDFDSSRYTFMSPIDVTRQTENGTEIGRWTVGDGQTATKLGMMRHFAARPGGYYVLRFPGKPAAKSFRMTVTNANRAEDSFMMAVSFDGRRDAVGYIAAGWENNREDPKVWADSSPLQKHVRKFTPVNSLAEVAASSGNRLWQDRANNLVWIKYQGGLPYQPSPPDRGTDSVASNLSLYQPYVVGIDAK